MTNCQLEVQATPMTHRWYSSRRSYDSTRTYVRKTQSEAESKHHTFCTISCKVAENFYFSTRLLTMAEATALRTAYTRLGFSKDAIEVILNREKMNDLKEIKILEDEDVARLCNVIQKPGGSIANPRAGETGQPPTIRNPGTDVAVKSETDLQLATYYLRHGDRISRPRTAADITLENIRKLRTLKKRVGKSQMSFPKLTIKIG